MYCHLHHLVALLCSVREGVQLFVRNMNSARTEQHAGRQTSTWPNMQPEQQTERLQAHTVMQTVSMLDSVSTLMDAPTVAKLSLW